MSFRGTVKNGVVILPPEAQLPDGAEVEVVVPGMEAGTDPFWDAVDKLAKPRPHWPDDYSLNHGHYLRGEPKRT